MKDKPEKIRKAMKNWPKWEQALAREYIRALKYYEKLQDRCGAGV